MRRSYRRDLFEVTQRVVVALVDLVQDLALIVEIHTRTEIVLLAIECSRHISTARRCADSSGI